MEYYHRFNKVHELYPFIFFVYDSLKVQTFGVKYEDKIVEPFVDRFYCEGSKTDPNCIRTTENTVELFRNKLSKKWDNDKYPPKWTNRNPPKWYKSNRLPKEVKENIKRFEKFANEIEIIPNPDKAIRGNNKTKIL